MVKWVVLGSAWTASWQQLLQGAAGIHPLVPRRHPSSAGQSDVTHIYCYLVSCRMALTLQAHWDRGSDFCLLCLLAAWHHEHLWTGLLNHEQILTNISGQLRNQVLGQSGKWNICAVVNSPHSVPPTALETVGFTICLQKHNWISLLLHYQYSISWSWLYMS